jgi:hypothetical protein
VARHTFEFARAFSATRPDLVGAMVLNPDLDVPDGIDQLLATGKVVPADRVDLSGARIYHVIASSSWRRPLTASGPLPVAEAGLALVVRLHDQIPQILPGTTTPTWACGAGAWPGRSWCGRPAGCCRCRRSPGMEAVRALGIDPPGPGSSGQASPSRSTGRPRGTRRLRDSGRRSPGGTGVLFSVTIPRTSRSCLPRTPPASGPSGRSSAGRRVPDAGGPTTAPRAAGVAPEHRRPGLPAGLPERWP